MSTWLKLLPVELGEITEKEYIEPQEELDPQKFHIVGEMTDDLKRLYTLWLVLSKERDECALTAKYAKDEREEKLNIAKYAELEEKTDVVKRIFWISLRDEFGLWNKLDGIRVGVSKGFKVVWAERPPRGRSFLDGLMGDLF